MFKQIKLSALFITAGMAFTASSQTANASVEQLTDALLAQTIAATQSELNNSIQGAILSAANMFSLEEQQTYATKVTITDLSSEADEIAAEQAE